MKTASALLAIVLIAATTMAADPFLIITPTGYYRVAVVDGVPEVSRYDQVIDLTKGQDDKPVIDHPEPSELEKLSRSAAVEIGDPITAGELADAIRDTDRDPEAMQAAIIAVLRRDGISRDVSDRWFFQWRVVMNDAIAEHMANDGDYEAAMVAVERGLRKASEVEQ